jgi:prefoldin subunit 5
MKVKLSKIILWPKRAELQPRVVQFNLTGVSVITGGSQRGKSALIWITDYCLGSDKCAIPVGDIRKTTSWFGIVLRLPHSELLLCRRNPEEQAATEDMFMCQADPVVVPTTAPTRNCGVRQVISRLNDLAGLPSIPVLPDDESSFGRPSIRDMAAFEFQPQHIVANPYTLYFKADTQEHQQKLREIFPFVLGAEDAETMEKRRALKEAERRLEEKRGELAALKRAAEVWTGQLRAAYATAKEYGLMPQAPDDADPSWDIPAYVAHLKAVPRNPKELPIPQVEPGATRRVARQISALKEEEENLTQAIADRRRKMTRISNFNTTTQKYRSALTDQGGRLQPVHWFSERIADTRACPFCGSDQNPARRQIDELAAEAERIEDRMGATEAATSVLDRETLKLQKEAEDLERQLNTVRTQMAAMEEQSEELKTRRQAQRDIDYFIGQLRTQLASIEASDQTGAVAGEVAKLEREVGDLRRAANPSLVKTRENDALATITESIRHYAEILGVERAERKANLDIRNLTVVVEGPDGRKDFLWEIGSAANWMGYHVAALLALHEHFLGLTDSAVPQFLILDQPSQAFFAGGYAASRGSTKGPPKARSFTAEEIDRVRRVFKALSDAVTRTRKRLQVIVLEHAEEETWQGLANVNLVQRWRGNEFLVPPEWLQA